MTNILEILVDTNKSLCTPVVPCTFIKVFICRVEGLCGAVQVVRSRAAATGGRGGHGC